MKENASSYPLFPIWERGTGGEANRRCRIKSLALLSLTLGCAVTSPPPPDASDGSTDTEVSTDTDAGGSTDTPDVALSADASFTAVPFDVSFDATRVDSSWRDGASDASRTLPDDTPAGTQHVTSMTPCLGAGDNHTCVLRADRSVGCWGVNDRFQLGDGTTGPCPAPRRLSGW